MRSSGNTSVGKITTIQRIKKLKLFGKLTSKKKQPDSVPDRAV